MNPSPGPWRWVMGYWDVYGLAAGNGDKIMQGGSSGDFHLYNQDDAALVTIAPEMREMLLRVELWSDNCPDCDSPIWSANGSSPIHEVGCGYAALLEKLR